MTNRSNKIFFLQNLTEVSIDSGRGTMATVTTLSSRMSNNPRQRPMPAIHQYQSQIPEDRENSLGDSDRSAEGSSHSGNFQQRKRIPNGPMPGPLMRHPPSPPVRLRDRLVTFSTVLFSIHFFFFFRKKRKKKITFFCTSFIHVYSIV